MTEEKTQLERFKETARELGVGESDDALDKVFGKLDLKKTSDVNEEKPNTPN